MKNFFKLAFIIALILTYSVTFAENDPQIAANKQIAVKFLIAVANDHSFTEAAKYLGPYYIQHNLTAHDGIEGLREYIQFLHDKRPLHRNKIYQVVAEGNYVIVHALSTNSPQDRGSAVFDMFRLEHKKIVEHWDAEQEIPANPKNKNGMF